MRPGRIAALALAAQALVALPSWARDRVALAVENRSTNPAATADVTTLVTDLLGKKRYEVVSAGELAASLVDGGLGVAPEAVQQVARALKTDAVVTVTIEMFLDAQERSKGPRASPAIAMSARMFSRDGRTVWRNSLAEIAEQAVALSRTRFERRGRGREANGEVPRISAASQAAEVLLWTIPRGQPTAEELAAMRAPPPTGPAPEPVKSTRFESAPPRKRLERPVARFPLRIDRGSPPPAPAAPAK